MEVEESCKLGRLTRYSYAVIKIDFKAVIEKKEKIYT